MGYRRSQDVHEVFIGSSQEEVGGGKSLRAVERFGVGVGLVRDWPVEIMERRAIEDAKVDT